MDYNYDSASHCYYVRLDEGEKIIESLSALAKENDIRYASILSGIGSVDTLQMGACHTSEDKSLNKVLSGHFSINAMQGTILLQDNQPTPHIHINYTEMDITSKNISRGGHMFEGTCKTTMEIVISRAANAFFKREENNNDTGASHIENERHCAIGPAKEPPKPPLR